jgi:hypothetical protein
VVVGSERRFFGFEGQTAEALTGTHLPQEQDQVIGYHGAHRVAVLIEGELDGGQGDSPVLLSITCDLQKSKKGTKDGRLEIHHS